MKIYLIRHSESMDDIEHCYGGIADFDLTENGRNKVKEDIHFILEDSKGLNSIAIITHGGVFRSIFKNILHVNKKIGQIDDVATTILEYDTGKFNILETKGIELGENIE